jgi:hypothetical protein
MRGLPFVRVRDRWIGQIRVGLQIVDRLSRGIVVRREPEARNARRRETHDRAEDADVRNIVRTLEIRKVAQTLERVGDRNAGNACGNEPAVRDHIARRNEGGRAMNALIREPTQNRIGIARPQVVPDRRAGRRSNFLPRDLTEHDGKLIGNRTIVERNERNRHPVRTRIRCRATDRHERDAYAREERGDRFQNVRPRYSNSTSKSPAPMRAPLGARIDFTVPSPAA